MKSDKAKEPSIGQKPEKDGFSIPDYFSSLSLSKNRNLIFILVTLVLVALIATILVFVNKAATENKIQRETTEAQTVRFDDINYLLAQENYVEAHAKADSYIMNAENDNVLKEAYLLSSSIYFSEGNYTTAIDEAKKADALGSDYATVAAIAGYANVAGYKDVALEYTRQQLELLDPQDPMYQQTTEDLQRFIDEWEAGL